MEKNETSTPLKAYFFKERSTGIEGVAFAPSPSKARYRVLFSARDAGYHICFPDISIKRAKEYDGATIGGQPVKTLCYDAGMLEKRSTDGQV